MFGFRFVFGFGFGFGFVFGLGLRFDLSDVGVREDAQVTKVFSQKKLNDLHDMCA